MKIPFMMLLALLSASASAGADEKTAISAAVQKLADKSYTWTTYDNSPLTPANKLTGRADGQGWAEVKAEQGSMSWPVVWKSGKTVIKISDTWSEVSEARQRARSTGFKTSEDGKISYTATGRAIWVLGRMRTFRPPAEDLAKFLEDARGVERNGSTYTIKLSDEAIKRLAHLNPEEDGSQPEVPKEMNGTVKVRLGKETIEKYEISLRITYAKGTGERASTTTIKEVGKTTVKIPEDVKPLLP
jgi:hypothetical protein